MIREKTLQKGQNPVSWNGLCLVWHTLINYWQKYFTAYVSFQVYRSQSASSPILTILVFWACYQLFSVFFFVYSIVLDSLDMKYGFAYQRENVVSENFGYPISQVKFW